MNDNSSGEMKKTIVINGGYVDTTTGALIHSSSKRRNANTANKTQKNTKSSAQSKAISRQVLENIRKRYKSASTETGVANVVDELVAIQTPVVTGIGNPQQFDISEIEDNPELTESIKFLEKLAQNVQSQPLPSNVEPHELHRRCVPQYGCLKGGKLNTFRNTQKIHNQNPQNPTQNNRPTQPVSGGGSVYFPQQQSPSYPPSSLRIISQNTPVAQGGSVLPPLLLPKDTKTGEETDEEIENQIKGLSVIQQFAQENPQSSFTEENKNTTTTEPSSTGNGTSNYQKRIIRRTHRVGRSKRLPVVSVLLPNKTIRSRVASHSKTLKTLPMPQVKKSLVKTGMIKIGSDAPENVLREIYENMCLIGGPVMNYNPDILYYNMVHE